MVVLDSAGYAAFTITHGISIIAPPGVYAGISVFSGEDGITINAGASDTVILHGLTVNNQGSTGSGIVFNTGGTLHVEGCVVNGFNASSTANGIKFLAGANLEVKDSIFRGNDIGILVRPSSGTAQAAIDQVRLENGNEGLFVLPSSTVTVRNSLASGNSADGFAAASGTAAPAELDIENCVASNNGLGIVASSSSSGAVTVRVSNSTVTHNGAGLDNVFGAPGLLLSRGNNTVEGNTSDTSGPIGSYTAK